MIPPPRDRRFDRAVFVLAVLSAFPGVALGDTINDAAAGSASLLLGAPVSEVTRERAVQCLAQAVYYEAALELPAGQAAVAQVVLNRLRHPAYPKSVCGVVFQGAERSTGCQFTFACDGSLARRPTASRWAAARRVARDVLAGDAAPEVGASTHYHAAWMVPYWRASLVETRRLGGHIFYRMPGFLGSDQALSGRYSGDEPTTPVTVAGGDGVLPRHPFRRGPFRPAVFSVWGLTIATVTARRGEVIVSPQ